MIFFSFQSFFSTGSFFFFVLFNLFAFYYISASVAFLECHRHLQDFIVIDSPLVKFPFEYSNPAVFGEI